ncbi:MAG: methyltransferase [Nitrosomonas sp.]|nr:methyltransferase [Nitrosomonas sp.]MDP1949491.1 methyltransferase [Nitrosomonas sp.]
MGLDPMLSNFLSWYRPLLISLQRSSLLVALFIQLLTLFTISLLGITLPIVTLSIFELAVLQGISAAIISHKLKMPIWWVPIHLIFIPAIITTLALTLSPLWFCGAFFILILMFGKTYQTKVPLYLSSHKAASVLASLLPKHKDFSLIDLGCGCGGLLAHISKIQPKGNFFGVEAAPIPFLLSKLRTMANSSNCRIQWGDFWKHDLSPYDVVYAYLSPAPMESLWDKACKEMRPGSILISNSFIIPGVKPEKCLKLNDLTDSTLYLWRI